MSFFYENGKNGDMMKQKLQSVPFNMYAVFFFQSTGIIHEAMGGDVVTKFIIQSMTHNIEKINGRPNAKYDDEDNVSP